MASRLRAYLGSNLASVRIIFIYVENTKHFNKSRGRQRNTTLVNNFPGILSSNRQRQTNFDGYGHRLPARLSPLFLTPRSVYLHIYYISIFFRKIKKKISENSKIFSYSFIYFKFSIKYQL